MVTARPGKWRDLEEGWTGGVAWRMGEGQCGGAEDGAATQRMGDKATARRMGDGVGATNLVRDSSGWIGKDGLGVQCSIISPSWLPRT